MKLFPLGLDSLFFIFPGTRLRRKRNRRGDLCYEREWRAESGTLTGSDDGHGDMLQWLKVIQGRGRG